MTALTLDRIVDVVRGIHDRIRDDIIAACEQAASDAEMAGIAHDGPGDTIYAIDKVSEDTLISEIQSTIATHETVLLVAEGIEPDGRILLGPESRPHAEPESDASARPRWTLLVDPIDGTRGLMYQKRSAWILTAIAPGSGRTLQDCQAAVMTEIPLVKQHCSDQLWAMRGMGTSAIRWDRIRQTSTPITITPSRSDTLAHGFSQISRFFPGGRDILAAIDDEVMQAVCGPAGPGKALCFEDQYLSTGGQFYELLVGHDRFVADIRPLLNRGSLCCHPYDCGALLIAQEAGVIITDERGAPLDCPLDIHADVSWIGYANNTIRDVVEPRLLGAIHAHGLGSASSHPVTNAHAESSARSAPDPAQALAADPLFGAGETIHTASAPGRLDFLGGIADYSGSLVLQWPIDRDTTAAVQLRSDDRIQISSHMGDDHRTWNGSWSELANERQELRRQLAGDWAAYVIGVAAVFADTYQQTRRGMTVVVQSNVLAGAGISSSAAVEVACLRALASAYGHNLSGEQIATLAQEAENTVVGAPCGIMDQMTSACGISGQLLKLLCQPGSIQGHLALPADLAVWGIDSGVRHAVSGADYGAVRSAAFMAKTILRANGHDCTYLTNFSPSQWSALETLVPKHMRGDEFTDAGHDLEDPVSTLNPSTVYSPRACARHPIMEHHRIQMAAELLGQAALNQASTFRSDTTKTILGELMYQSHASYSACGLGTPATDALVTAVRAAQAAGAPLYGAKITGGGAGGTVAIPGCC